MGYFSKSSTARQLIGGSDADKLKRLQLEASIRGAHAQYISHLKEVVQFVAEKSNQGAC